jgi:site-specific DNA-cytosine methylase
MNIPVVVNKNDADGNFCKTEGAKVFINKEPIARTLTCKCGGGQEVHHNNMVLVVREVGRNPDNPTSRKKGLPLEQRIEIKEEIGMAGTLTTVQKDNMLLDLRKPSIRKLTPKECWRLMGYTDEDFDNAKNAGVSNSQLYKQAGNAIVKQVLMAIFKQMLP